MQPSHLRAAITAGARAPLLHARVFARACASAASSYRDPHGVAIPFSPVPDLRQSPKERIACYRVVDLEGVVEPGVTVPDIAPGKLVEMHQKMVLLRTMDNVLYDAQRQGRISFYLTCSGEEAIGISTAAALHPMDPIFSQYREQGALLWRGFSLNQFANQNFSNARDPGKGRQMPVHYGCPELAFHFVSSPLATQVPHAAGCAFALKRENAAGGIPRCAVSYCGDGAASEGDFHAALNIASTMSVPCMFVVRNNGFAISTPVKEQFAGDGIASRAAGYGMASIRVDGNDLLATHHATQLAREYCVENSKPVLVECMSYRVAHHSTSDDASRYRDPAEVEAMRASNCPIRRSGLYLKQLGLWTDEQQAALEEKARRDVLTALKHAEAESKTPLRDLFEDVYDTPSESILRQRASLKAHLEKHREQYEHVLRTRRMSLNLDL